MFVIDLALRSMAIVFLKKLMVLADQKKHQINS